MSYTAPSSDKDKMLPIAGFEGREDVPIAGWGRQGSLSGDMVNIHVREAENPRIEGQKAATNGRPGRNVTFTSSSISLLSVSMGKWP